MEDVKSALISHYRLTEDFSMTPHEGGFLSTNYLIKGARRIYFLKGYRFDEREKIAEIHRIKFFFHSQGLPVVLPLETSDGNTFITVKGKHYAIFPYIEGRHHNRGSIPPRAIENLARLLADMHKAGALCDFEVKSGFKDKGAQTFMEIGNKIKKIIECKKDKNAFDLLALEHLELKLDFARTDHIPAESFFTEKPILLHGDFQEQNIFFDNGDGILGVFDFEQAHRGSRSYELWRSADLMFLNGNFTRKGINDVILYMRTYNIHNPIGKADLVAGLEIHYRKIARSLWIEQEHYLKGSNRVDVFLENRHTCLLYLLKHKDALLREIVLGVYGA